MKKPKALIKKIIEICCLIMFIGSIFTTIFFFFDLSKDDMKTSDIIGTVLCGFFPICVLFGFLSYRLLRKSKNKHDSVDYSTTVVQKKGQKAKINTSAISELTPNDNTENNDISDMFINAIISNTKISSEIIEDDIKVDTTKSEPTTYVLTNGMIYRADGKPIEDNEVPYLMELGRENAQNYYSHSNNPKFHRTKKEQELSFKFSQHYGIESTKRCDVFEKLYRDAYETDNIKEEIQLLRQALETFEEVKQWHYNKSKGGMIYFQDFYEYMHNSRNECFSWVDSVKQNLSELENVENFIIPWILENAKNGFLQTDIYKAFPEDNKSFLRNVIKQLIDSDYLTSEKQGRTYFITATDKQY